AEQLLDDAEATGHGRFVIWSLVLRAVILHAQGDGTGALASLRRALALAEPEGYVRMFVNQGAPIAALLTQSVERRAQNDLLRVYAERLLSAFPSHQPRETAAAADAPPVLRSTLERSNALIEPLSPRELEVLRLLADGKDNAQIAGALSVAVSTVKAHINHIFGKLSVHSRLEAVLCAQELDLL